jgi:ribonuclease D
VVKVFHGADYDIVCLKRDYGFEIHNVFDTMVSSQQLGNLPGVGLADLVLEFFGVELEKKFQRHDWAERPLRDEHLEYARGDTHWLLALREILLRRLRRAGRLERVIEECRLLERREWEGRTFDPEGWLRIRTGGVPLDDDGRRVLRKLWRWRDDEARRADRPPFKTIPDPVLVEVARARPRTDAEIEQLFPRGKSAMKRRFGMGFLRAVADGLADESPLPTLAQRRSSGPPSRLPGRLVDSVFEALKQWRNGVVSANPNLAPVAVIANGALKNIAKMRPETLEQLAAVPDVRQWQVDAHGTEILHVLDRVAPIGSWKDEAPTGRRRRRRG